MTIAAGARLLADGSRYRLAYRPPGCGTLTELADSLAEIGRGPGGRLPPLIDLSTVDQAQRAVVWSGAAARAFPGLSLKLPGEVLQQGTIRRVPLAAGELVAIESAPVEVTYRPPSGAYSAHVSLMMQAHGSTRVRQHGRQCELAEGDICLIDESSAFRLVGEDTTEIVFLRLPRRATLSRHPQLERLYANALPGSEPGTRLLADTLQRLFADAAELDDAQRAAAMDAMLHLLGVVGPLGQLSQAPDWRVCRAIEFIELNLATGGLSAEDVAREQNISRRRLDQLMRETVGHSIAGHLWNRRLERAAADLRDPRRAGTSAAQVAFANGFEDAAHFSRAFKRRYGCTPGQWRLSN